MNEKCKYPNGSCMYQLETYKAKNNEQVDITAPSCPMKIIIYDPLISSWKSGPTSNEKKFDIDPYWVIDPKFKYKRIFNKKFVTCFTNMHLCDLFTPFYKE